MNVVGALFSLLPVRSGVLCIHRLKVVNFSWDFFFDPLIQYV